MKTARIVIALAISVVVGCSVQQGESDAAVVVLNDGMMAPIDMAVRWSDMATAIADMKQRDPEDLAQTNSEDLSTRDPVDLASPVDDLATTVTIDMSSACGFVPQCATGSVPLCCNGASCINGLCWNAPGDYCCINDGCEPLVACWQDSMHSTYCGSDHKCH